jgi:hypothetical protein
MEFECKLYSQESATSLRPNPDEFGPRLLALFL